ncbi:sugar porter family MFS transporter [Rothia uropygialis]|uniref:sugar porter family MFS transporter n=1 Tax=Kocuria sp. 36 TaxID=1415402 RepID=UPI00101BDD77|nr:sugar porter family MFS transporter [Kocuria sp. 36]
MSIDQDPPSSRPLPPLTPGPYRKRLGLISTVACFGGLLYGYDTGVINGALRPMSAELGLTSITEGIATSALVFAAAFGAFFGGRVADAKGRRTAIIALSVLFFAGSVLVVATPNLTLLVLGRIFLGLGVGGASTVVPVFLAELAPFEIRGSIAGRNEVAIVIGQLSAFVINAILGSTLGHLDGIWRLMFAISAMPAVCLFVGMLRMPESPRWLVENGRRDQALEVLRSVRPESRAEIELEDVQATAQDEKHRRTGLGAILKNKWLFRILLVGIGVAIMQRITGIDTIMFYGQIVLIQSGFGENAALIANIAPGIVAVIGGFTALYMMDRVDRRTTFTLGISLTTVFHLLIGIASMIIPEGNAVKPWILLVLIVGFVASMQTFLNVAVWVYLAEVFPLHMRGVANGLAVFCGWMSNGVLSLTFPSLIDNLGMSTVFFLFFGVGVLALIFVRTQVPETRGRSLEVLEDGVTTGTIYKVPVKRK